MMVCMATNRACINGCDCTVALILVAMFWLDWFSAVYSTFVVGWGTARVP
jgi:hypothetical protein